MHFIIITNKERITILFLWHFLLGVQVIRVKWSLHAREEILFELAQHLKGTSSREILATIRRGTREMISEQEAVRDRIFTVQDAMHNAVRSVLQVGVLLEGGRRAGGRERGKEGGTRGAGGVNGIDVCECKFL